MANFDWIPLPVYLRTLQLLFVLQPLLSYFKGAQHLVRTMLFPLREALVSFRGLAMSPLPVQVSCHPTPTTVEFRSTGVDPRINNPYIPSTPTLDRTRSSHKVASLPNHLLSRLLDTTYINRHQFGPLVLNILNRKALIVRLCPLSPLVNTPISCQGMPHSLAEVLEGPTYRRHAHYCLQRRKHVQFRWLYQ